jgi:demethylmenaquinone methyltransferase/2-methoxy-6-polyprenyl-1,4-benzoquinol methylase
MPGTPATSSPLDKRGRTIQEMFGAVAPRYDLLNRVLSARRDVAWRRLAAEAMDDLAVDGPVLDLCCGTGDQAMALAERGRQVVAADFCIPMVAIAQGKLARQHAQRASRNEDGRALPPLTADALLLPFADDSFAGATVSFGVRNVADLDQALGELHRVIRPGGRLAILEATVPTKTPFRQAYLLYFENLLPKIGGLLSFRGSAYEYFADSVLEFPSRDQFLARLEAAGFSDNSWQDLFQGVACLYRGHA